MFILMGLFKQNWGGKYENVAILIAIGVINKDGYLEVIVVMKGMKEDKDSWAEFFKWLNSRGLSGTNMVIGDKCFE
jgi:transposase-like protein